ncbi:zinc-dependent alcohol dehydrogenase [Salinarimonas chemoclinalis]|uniref:zinc-dependent alcohol dehydrogenase n=1 Tax=Salinarimonas chemoclinalis TaxID=3241599 RepID=UPI003556E746
MRALELRAGPSLALVDRPRPRVEAEDDVVVRIVHSGICGTDRSILVGKFAAVEGTVLGHESVGLVEAVGPAVEALQPGDRVIVNPTLYCGQCDACRAGRLNFCSEKRGNEIGIDRDGTFADAFRVSARFLHRVPDDMSLERAVMVEPLVCALNNVRAGGLSVGETIIVLGGGPMGVITTMLALRIGAVATLVEADPTRRELCREILGGLDDERLTIVAPDAPALAAGADVVVDSVGNLLETAVPLARSAGRVVVMGFDSRATATLKPLDILMRGVRIIGAGDYDSAIFPLGVELARTLPLERVVTDRLPLEKHEEAFARLSPQKGAPYGAMKVLLVSSPEDAS